MMFIPGRKLPVSGVVLAGLALGYGIMLSPVFGLASPPIPQAASEASFTARDYTGTWHWIFNGKNFATMVLSLKDDQFIGSVSNCSISTDSDGKIVSAEPSTGTSSIVRTSMNHGVLVIVASDEGDEIEWAVTLKSPSTAEVKLSASGGPMNTEVFHAEKVK